MIIRLSSQLASKIKEKNLQSINREVGPFEEWYARSFSHDRLQLILATNAFTLYSVVMYGRGITEHGKFITQFNQHLNEVLESDGLTELIKVVAPKFASVSFAKSNNRSIIGSMNDMVFQAKFMAAHRDVTTPFGMTKLVNNTPYGYLKMHFPIKEMEHLNKEFKIASP